MGRQPRRHHEPPHGRSVGDLGFPDRRRPLVRGVHAGSHSDTWLVLFAVPSEQSRSAQRSCCVTTSHWSKPVWPPPPSPVGLLVIRAAMALLSWIPHTDMPRHSGTGRTRRSRSDSPAHCSPRALVRREGDQHRRADRRCSGGHSGTGLGPPGQRSHPPAAAPPRLKKHPRPASWICGCWIWRVALPSIPAAVKNASTSCSPVASQAGRDPQLRTGRRVAGGRAPPRGAAGCAGSARQQPDRAIGFRRLHPHRPHRCWPARLARPEAGATCAPSTRVFPALQIARLADVIRWRRQASRCRGSIMSTRPGQRRELPSPSRSGPAKCRSRWRGGPPTRPDHTPY